MKQIKEILIASVSLFLLGFGICMAVSTFFMYRDRKSTRLNSSHMSESRMPSSA